MFSVPLRATEAAREPGTNAAPAPTVLVTSRPPRHRVDYVDQLTGDDSRGEAPSGVVWEFRTDPSRTRGADVLYLTDITAVIGDASTPLFLRVRRAKRFTKMLRRRHIALVRMIQGEERTRPTSRAEVIVDKAAMSVVSMNLATASDGREARVIAHSHFRDRFLGFPRADSVPGRALMTAVDTLHPSCELTLKVFSVAALPGWTLRIAGKIPPNLFDSFARTLADHTDTMSTRDEVLSDAARLSEICQAEIVIVVNAEGYEAQSIIMLALSLDRPVLVEDTAATRALAEEVGSSWVRRHTGPLTARTLEAALTSLRADPPTDRPNLDARDPNIISGHYTAVFRDAAAAR